MKRNLFILLITLPIFLLRCDNHDGLNKGKYDFTIRVQNPLDEGRKETLVTVNSSDLPGDAQKDLGRMLVYYNDAEIASQFSDSILRFVTPKLEANATATFYLKRAENLEPRNYVKRTQAELSIKDGGRFENRKYIGGDFKNVQYLRVPEEHTDHSYYIRYEGPGWESDLVGYRFYLDWRNATDVFGKKTHKMVLQQVGLDGFDSYHEMQEWGVDVLKVGSSLGVGTLGMYYDDHAVRIDDTDSVICEIVENGNIYSKISTKYYGWKCDEKKYDVNSNLSIHAGTRLTHHEIHITGQPDNLCTGVGKDSNAKLYTYPGSEDSWGFLATYGLQSLNNDHLGLAVFFAGADYKGFTEDDHSHIVKLEVKDQMLDYYFMATWEGEKNAIATEEAFFRYVMKVAEKLAKPIEIAITN